MRNGIYSEWLEAKIKELPAGEVFESVQMVQLLSMAFDLTKENARCVANNKLKRMSDKQQITRMSKGIYYNTRKTVFGEIAPNISKYAIHMLTYNQGEVIGYESGASFLNKVGLSTLVTKDITITTNNYRKQLPAGCHVIAKKPRLPITSENYRYLQILDAIFSMNHLPIDVSNPKTVLGNIIKSSQLDVLKLLAYARQYYSQTVVLNTVDIITESAILGGTII